VKIAIDIDGVIADFVGAFLPKLNTICRCGFEDIIHYDFKENIPVDETEYAQLWCEEVTKGRIYEVLVPVEGAKVALEHLAEKHKILLISTRKRALKETTLKWLRDNGIPFHELHLVENRKEKIAMMSECDVAIEDDLEVARMVQRMGICTLLFDYPWNRIAKTIKRVNSWAEAVEVMEMQQSTEGNDER